MPPLSQAKRRHAGHGTKPILPGCRERRLDAIPFHADTILVDESEETTVSRTQQPPNPVLLGEVDVPSGILLVLDPGLARFWQHDGDPRSPRREDPEMFDLAVAGTDAVDVGRAYDRQFDPRFLFDQVNVDRSRNQFAEFVKTLNKEAHLEVLPRRIPHLERARLAVEIGGGAGIVVYNGLWSVAIAGVPTDRSLPILATPMPDGEFAERWRSIDVVIDAKAKASRSVSTQGVMVEHGQLLCSDLEAFGEFRMWQSLDGLADFVFQAQMRRGWRRCSTQRTSGSGNTAG